MKQMVKSILFLMIAVVGNSNWVYAQEGELVNNEGEIEDAQIVINKNREIELPRESKVYEFMKWQPKRSEFTMPKSRFVNYSFDQTLMPLSFDPVTVPVEKSGPTYYQYAKVGFGNYGSPLADISLVTPGNSNMLVGLNYKHLSFAKGAVDDKNSATSMNEVTAYAQLQWDKIKVKPSLTYRNDKNYFFGYPEGSVVSRDSLKRSNSYFDFDVNIMDNNDADDWTYSLDIGFHNFSDNYQNKEIIGDVNAFVGFKNKIYVDADMAWSTFDNGSSVSRSLYRIVPYYALELGDLSVDLGVSASLQSDTLSTLSANKFFPYLNADFGLSENYNLFFKLDAGYNFNSMNSLSRELPYLNPAFGIANSQRDVDVNGGLQGDLTEKLFFELRGGYQSVKNLPLYVNNSTDQALIDIAYDSTAVGIMNLGVTAQYAIHKNHQISLSFDYFGYSAGSYGEVYGRPTTQLKVKGNHHIIEKLSIQWQFDFIAGIRAYDPNADLSVDLDPIPKMDLMAHYQINDQWGAFASVENIFNVNYSRFLFYPQKGIMFKLGATYRF